MLYITNTKTGKKEQFVPKQDGKVNLYVCGITPYDFAHIGHGRCYVMFDLLYRLLIFSGYQVAYCRNFTDIDDKILNRAEKNLQIVVDIKKFLKSLLLHIMKIWKV